MRPGMQEMIIAAVPVIIAILPSAALACGACIEDKVAATYDHAVIARAAERHHLVVFCEVSGPFAPATAVELAASAVRVKGLVPGSVRTSLTPSAVSFVVDPAAQSPAAAAADLQRRARVPGLRLTVVKTMQGFRFID